MECRSKLDYAVRIDTLCEILNILRKEGTIQWDMYDPNEPVTDQYIHKHHAYRNMCVDVEGLLVDAMLEQHAIREN